MAKFVSAFMSGSITRFGWLLLLGGLVVPGIQLYDRMTTNPAVATVIDLKPLCQKKVMAATKARWRKIKCAEMDALEAAGTTVRSRPYAKLSFTGTDGRERTAWASFSKLEISSVEIGQRLDIAYRGNKRPYVAPPFQPRPAGLGLLISIVGGGLLMAASGTRKADASTAGSSTTAATTTPAHDRVRARNEEQSPLRTRPPASRGAKLAKSSADIYTRPTGRQGAVQRNSGWFG